ncbi:MAG: CocE/NonD family hydrolase, partial [Pseudomonadota bacterium]
MSGPVEAAEEAAHKARETVKFLSCGTPIDAWFYAPPEGAPAPAILMAHGMTCVKDQYLDDYAQRFNAAGYAVLVIDYRFLGASGGEPRGLVIPANQHDDLRASLQWLTDHPAVDAARIG